MGQPSTPARQSSDHRSRTPSYTRPEGQPSTPARQSSDHRSGTPSYTRPVGQPSTPADRRLLLKPGRCTNDRSSASARDESSDTLYSEASQIRDALSQNSDAQHAGIAHLTDNDERAPVVQNSRQNDDSARASGALKEDARQIR